MQDEPEKTLVLNLTKESFELVCLLPSNQMSFSSANKSNDTNIYQLVVHAHVWPELLFEGTLIKIANMMGKRSRWYLHAHNC